MKLYIADLHYNNQNDFKARFFKSLLRFCSFFYGAAVCVRNFLYDKNFLRSHKSSPYVISVGNLTTGGVGKTPVVNAIAKFLTAKGNKVCILSRGYGGKLSSGKPYVISDGKNIFYEPEQSGDEPFWHAQNSDAAVVVSKDRVKGADFAFKTLGSNIVILDDGFQHRRIRRDLNILLVDSEKRFGNGEILPLGPLREPLNELRRADKIVIVDKGAGEKNIQKTLDVVSKYFNQPICTCKMAAGEVYNIETGVILERGTRVVAFCAIGQPSQFYRLLEADFELAATADFEDHANYDIKDLDFLLELMDTEDAKALVTTEKDAVKFKDLIKKTGIEIDVFAMRLQSNLDVEALLMPIAEGKTL